MPFFKRKVDPRRELAGRLADTGFWVGVPTDEQKARAERFIGGSPLEADAGVPGWWVDGEDLAEGEVETLLISMAPTLETLGVTLDVATLEGPHDPTSSGYSVRINGVDLDLYRLDPTDHSMPLTADPWGDCTIRPLARVNQLLDAAKSQHQLIVFHPGGNDGRALLVSDEIIRLLSEADWLSDPWVIPNPDQS